MGKYRSGNDDVSNQRRHAQWRINIRADGAYVLDVFVGGPRAHQLLIPLGPTYTCISHNDNKDLQCYH